MNLSSLKGADLKENNYSGTVWMLRILRCYHYTILKTLMVGKSKGRASDFSEKIDDSSIGF